MAYDYQELLPKIITIAEQAGRAILDIYQNAADVEVQTKADNSPLTNADLAAQAVVEAELTQLTPDIPIISEESPEMPFAERQKWSRCWLVDPLDGTKEFISRTDEFTVNIALIEAHRPVLGVINVPVLGECYYALEDHGAYYRNARGEERKLATRRADSQQLMFAASRRHNVERLKAIVSQFGSCDVMHVGSALKFGMIAKGVADVYVRTGSTSEWDTAAGQCIVEQAGGHVLGLDGQPLRYNARDTLINPEFVAVGDIEVLPICLNVLGGSSSSKG